MAVRELKQKRGDNHVKTGTAVTGGNQEDKQAGSEGGIRRGRKRTSNNSLVDEQIQLGPNVPSVICLSHREDVDGLASAALVKSAFKGCHVILLDYSNLIRQLKRLVSLTGPHPDDIPSEPLGENGTGESEGNNNSNEVTKARAGNPSKRKRKTKKLIICDLGLNKKNEASFVNLLSEISSNGFMVEYVDHHDVSEEIKSELRRAGVTLVHSTQECTSVQVYQRYKSKLNPYSPFYAAAGALTDYLEQRPIASMLVSRFDRHFLMLESTALSYMISSNQHDENFLLRIVDAISKDKFPHDIEGGFMMAEKYAIKVSEAVKSLQNLISYKENLAYVRNDLDLTASVIVNFVLGISGRPVAAVYKARDEIDSFVVSIRGSKECEAHLGRIVNEVAANLGGSGGGHDKACGAVIPKDRLDEFITGLNRRI